MSDTVHITAKLNGSLLVRGPITMVDHDGVSVTLPGEVVALCRCGHSANKPFCDGSHTKAGFDGTLNPANRAG